VRYGRRAVTLGPVSAGRLLLVAALLGGCRHTLVVGIDPPEGGSPDGTPGPASLTEGLVAHWKLDDGPGSPRALDSSASANHAIPEAVSTTDWTAAGRIGGALMFGNAGWLRGTDAPSIDAIGERGLSLAMWIRVADGEDREQVILQRQAGTGGDAHFLLSLRLGRPALSGVALPRCEGPALPLDRWVHLAVTFDGASQRLLFDGAEVARCPAAGTFAPDTTSVTVGGGQFGPSPFSVDRRLRAFLDEVLVYSRPLDDVEVTALAGGQLPPGR